MFKNSLQLGDVRRLSSPSNHSAFTDLVSFRGKLFCCFRQGHSHVSDDGEIEITLINENGVLIQRSKLSVPGMDLRDPKFTVSHEEKLILIAHARSYNSKSKAYFSVTLSWFSLDGYSWSSHHQFGPNNWWLWRLRWHNDEAFGLAYNRGHDRVDLYKGHPRKQVECVKTHALSLQHHGLGYPNESDLYFEADGKLWALVRRDADSFSAQLGFACSPYTRWKWHDLKDYIGGPVMQPLCNDWMLVAGRQWTGRKLQTAIWVMQLSTHTLHWVAVLPSAGDNSYPGLVIDGDNVWVSYYSGHKDNQARVYLARLSGINALLDVIKQG